MTNHVVNDNNKITDDNPQYEKYKLIHEYTCERINECRGFSKDIEDKSLKILSIMSFLTGIAWYIQKNLNVFQNTNSSCDTLILYILLVLLIILSIIVLYQVIKILSPREKAYIPLTDELLDSMINFSENDLHKLYSELAKQNKTVYKYHENVFKYKSSELRLLFKILYVYIIVLIIYVVSIFSIILNLR